MTQRVACVGAGHWGKNLVRTFDALERLALVVEKDPERRDWLAEQYPGVTTSESIEDALTDPSIHGLAIATPAEAHGRMVRQALEAGKDVFVEKPLCLDVDEGRALVGLASSTGAVLMVGHLLWYHAAVQKLKELVGNGSLGRLRYISSNRLNLGKIRRTENILWSFAPHDISVILGLVGEMPSAIRAQGANFLHEEIADVTTTFFNFPSGVHAHIVVSWLHPFKEQKLVVVGDRRMAVFDDLEPVNKLVVYPHTIEWLNNAPIASRADGEPVPLDLVEPLLTECREFLDCMKTRRTPRTDGKEALAVLEVLSECQRLLDDDHRRGRVRTEANLTKTESVPQPYTVHESAYVDEDVVIGEGSTVWHFSHIMQGSRIGKRCRIGQNVVVGPRAQVGDGVKIQNNVSVYEGVTLEDHVFCGPSMVFTNVYNPRSEIRRMDELRATLVKRGASLGANCTIVCGVTVGQYAFIGAGAVVNKDVPDYALVVGNPGRRIGWMCRCGNRLVDGEGTHSARCADCGSQYSSAGEGLGLYLESGQHSP